MDLGKIKADAGLIAFFEMQQTGFNGKIIEKSKLVFAECYTLI